MSPPPDVPAPPAARRSDHVDVLHGVEVPAPYRWMEDLDSPELTAWVDAAAAHAAAMLATLPGRGTLRRTLESVTALPTAAAPWRRGARWFQRRGDGRQDHDTLWVAEAGPGPGAPTEGWRVLLDPNTWTGARSLAGIAASSDGRWLAYAVAEAGSDWQTWHVRDVASGEDLADVVPWSKFAGASWLPDGTGFLTCTYDPPAAGEEHEAETSAPRVVVHRLGGETTTVHERPDAPQLGFSPRVSADGTHVVLEIDRGTDPETRIHVAALHGDGTIGPVRRLLDEADAAWHVIGLRDGELWCSTDLDAPLGRVVAVSIDDGTHREVVPEGAHRLLDARLVGDRRHGAGSDGGEPAHGRPGDTTGHETHPTAPGWLVLVRLADAVARVEVLGLDGARQHEVALPGLVTVPTDTDDAVTGGRTDTILHVRATSFTEQSVLVTHDLETGSTRWLGAVPDAMTDPTGGVPGPVAALLAVDVAVERVFVSSGDVRVPVFLVRRVDVEPTGAVPTVLWGYGGFDIAVGPSFRPGWRAWVAHGGLLAVACLRGGGEYGRAWYDDGRLAAKQHVFDDAIAVARWLAGEGDASWDRRGERRVDAPAWTGPDHLGIEGRSNGGLLVGACITQAPDAFASAVAEVGVLDMLRFHRFTIGWAWTSDYGDPEDPTAFAWLRSWSPLHAVNEGTAHPATLVTTGDTDDRVVPSHSYKFAAALWHAQAGDAPIALRVDRAAGHGAGKPRSQLLDERADVLAWHAHHLGLQVGADGP